RPLGERGAPGEAAAVVRNLAVVELHDGAHLPSQAEPRAVGLPLPLVTRLEFHLEPRIHALGVGGEEVPEPARDLAVATAREHFRSARCSAAAARRGLTLVEAAREALLAPFLVDKGRLATLFAQVTDLPAPVVADHRHV